MSDVDGEAPFGAELLQFKDDMSRNSIGSREISLTIMVNEVIWRAFKHHAEENHRFKDANIGKYVTECLFWEMCEDPGQHWLLSQLKKTLRDMESEIRNSDSLTNELGRDKLQP